MPAFKDWCRQCKRKFTNYDDPRAYRLYCTVGCEADAMDPTILPREPVAVQVPGYGRCPRCSADVARGEKGFTIRERGVDGSTHCGACGFVGPTGEWGKP